MGGCMGGCVDTHYDIFLLYLNHLSPLQGYLGSVESPTTMVGWVDGQFDIF